MSEPPHASLPPDQALERLLSEIHLRLRQGRLDDAAARLEEAKRLGSDLPAVLEAEGDLAFARGRYIIAERLYRQAFQADPTNAKLEEKFATALVKVHEPEYLSHVVPDDSPWSYAVRRPIWASALLSGLLPGLGQLYNGDLIKGAALLFLEIGMWSFAFSVLHLARQGGHLSQAQDIVPAFMHGGINILTSLFGIALWIYSIVDAALVAKATKEGLRD